MVDINRSDVENGDIREKNENFDVIAWLDRIGCAQYVNAFHKNGIDADILRSLTSEELRDDLGVVNLRHRRNILYEISLLGRLRSGVVKDELAAPGLSFPPLLPRPLSM
mmetsp:Transcript_7235/g.14872  ORF Transcript_7235/g.14872 Transcript_7235/m.14872 type:complete len:109 (-) Transcript_7235:4-330(-)